MYVLVNPVNQLVVLSSTTPIVSDTAADCFVTPGHRVYDPRPSSGVTVLEMDFPMASYCDYKMVNGQPVRITPLPPVPVPQVVTMRQARLALLEVGKLDAVAPAIASMPSPAKEQAQIEWEYSTTVERQRPLVLQLGPALGLDSAALDALFIAAEKL